MRDLSGRHRPLSPRGPFPGGVPVGSAGPWVIPLSESANVGEELSLLARIVRFCG